MTAANEDFEQARADDLPEGDQEWEYYYQGFNTELLAAAEMGWSEQDMRDAMNRIADDIYLVQNWEEVQARGVEYFCLPGSHDWVAYDVPTASQMLPDLPHPAKRRPRPGNLDSPDEAQAKSAFFAQIFAGGDEGLETMITNQDGNTLEVTVTFPKGGEPEDSRIFWMYDRGPDGSNWYLYELFPSRQLVHHDRQRKHLECIDRAGARPQHH